MARSSSTSMTTASSGSRRRMKVTTQSSHAAVCSSEQSVQLDAERGGAHGGLRTVGGWGTASSCRGGVTAKRDRPSARGPAAVVPHDRGRLPQERGGGPRWGDGRAARRRRPRPGASLDDLGRRALGAGRAGGLDAVGVATAEPVRRHPCAPRGPQGRRAARRDGVHLPATRPARPTRRRRCPAPGPSWSGRAAYRRRRRRRRRPATAPTAGSPATPGATTTPTLRGRLEAVADRAPGRRVARRGGGRRQRPRRPGGAYRAGLGWYGKNSQPAAARAGQLVRARRGRHRRPAGPDGRRARRRRLRDLPPLPRRLPDRRHRRSRRGRRPPLPGLAGAGARGASPRAPGGPRRPHLRLRRLPGGVPAEPAARDAGTSPQPAGPTGGPTPVGRPARAAGRRRRRAARPARPLVHRRPRPPLAAPQRAGRARQRRRSADDPAVVAALRRATWPIPTRCCGPTPPGPPAASAATTCWLARRRRRSPDVAAELVAAAAVTAAEEAGREAPAGHQRLPAQGRRHPVLPVGAVAPAAARRGHRPHHAPPRRRARGTPSRRFRVVRIREPGPAARPPAWSPQDRRAWPTRSAPTWCVLDPALPLGPRSGPASAGPTASCCTAPRSPCPGACPGPRRLLGAGAAGRRAGGRRRRLPGRPRPSGPPAGRCPSWWCRPGVDIDAVPTPGRRRAGRGAGRLRPARRRRRWSSASAGSCPARAWTC